MRLRLPTFVSLVLLAGCALPGNVVVDVPDEEGQIGRVRVSNASGNVELTSPLAAVGLEPGAAPGRPFITDQQVLNRVFAKVLEATPRRPVTFVIHFQPGSTQLTPQSSGELARAIAAARTTSHPEISVIEHAGEASLDDPNDALALARARGVAANFVSAGIPPSVIALENYGVLLAPTASGGMPEPQNAPIEVMIR